jgi:hypothetical protein
VPCFRGTSERFPSSVSKVLRKHAKPNEKVSEGTGLPEEHAFAALLRPSSGIPNKGRESMAHPAHLPALAGGSRLNGVCNFRLFPA